jgi:hypothetical protein
MTKRKAKHYMSQASIACKVQRGRKQNNVASFVDGLQNSERKPKQISLES